MVHKKNSFCQLGITPLCPVPASTMTMNAIWPRTQLEIRFENCAVKLAPSVLIPNVQLQISANNCVTLTFTSLKIILMINNPIQNYLLMSRRKISSSSTTTCQESSRSIKVFHVEKIMILITCQESSRSSSCRRSECLSCSSPCFWNINNESVSVYQTQ